MEYREFFLSVKMPDGFVLDAGMVQQVDGTVAVPAAVMPDGTVDCMAVPDTDVAKALGSALEAEQKRLDDEGTDEGPDDDIVNDDEDDDDDRDDDDRDDDRGNGNGIGRGNN